MFWPEIDSKRISGGVADVEFAIFPAILIVPFADILPALAKVTIPPLLGVVLVNAIAPSRDTRSADVVDAGRTVTD